MNDELEELQDAAVKEIENAYRIGKKVERDRSRNILDDFDVALKEMQGSPDVDDIPYEVVKEVNKLRRKLNDVEE